MARPREPHYRQPVFIFSKFRPHSILRLLLALQLETWKQDAFQLPAGPAERAWYLSESFQPKRTNRAANSFKCPLRQQFPGNS